MQMMRMIASIHADDLFAGVYQTMALISNTGWFVGHRPVAVVVLAEPLSFVSRDVAKRLAPVVKLIAQCAVGLLVAGKDAGQAHNVGGVTAYVDSLFHFVAHSLHNSLFLKFDYQLVALLEWQAVVKVVGIGYAELTTW